ncbi:pilin [Frankia sp. Cj3]|uniref:pilin n=1 Tax=Frankia sp. Cj3 TaxID=2880976 RepID=UPI001EF6B264|nr:pilin [Frankia sp. Cj3]
MRLTAPHPGRRRWLRAGGWVVLFVVVLVVLVVVAASVASAQVPPQQIPPPPPVAPNPGTVLNNIRNWIMGILAGLATVFLTVGGLRYITSGGEPGEVGKAKESFKHAGWGYGLAALAPLIVEILKAVVGTA